MGGANSKLKLNTGTIRRFEEFKKRRNAPKLEADKAQVKDGGHWNDDFHYSNETKPAEEVSTKEETPVHVVTAEKPSRVVPLPTSAAKHVAVEEMHVEKDSKHIDHHDQEKVEVRNESRVEHVYNHNHHDSQEKVKDSQENNVKQDEKYNNHDGQEKVEASLESNLKKDEKQNDHDDGKEKVSNAIEKAPEDIIIKKEQTEEPKEDHEEFVDVKGNVDVDEHRQDFGIFLPGSPSFRIYCIEANRGKVEQEELLLEEDDDEDEDYEEEEEGGGVGGEKQSIATVHQKAYSVDCVIRPPSESDSVKSTSLTTDSLNFETGIAKTGKEQRTKRNGKKAKKFGSAKMKRLFKVKSCYYPTCSCAGGVHEGRRMVASRAAN
ncbi:hypothetical protein PIB30_018935 [Stylosanthes scabra]|uniref:Uncharacterized protein n=1 Tax=Stylosanthes scabra TaxID=79078 RepID=A0ABU6Y9W9_9FABA|nr:hypothetical protein [Stylosanthes scabra]